MDELRPNGALGQNIVYEKFRFFFKILQKQKYCSLKKSIFLKKVLHF